MEKLNPKMLEKIKGNRKCIKTKNKEKLTRKMKYKNNQMRTNPLPRLGEGIYTPLRTGHVGFVGVQHSLGPFLGPISILRAIALFYGTTDTLRVSYNKPSEADKNAKTKVDSMVNVLIQQALSSISLQTSPIINLSSRPESPKAHQQFKATTTDTTTTTLPPPQAPQQSMTEAMMVKRIGELEHIKADLIQVNKDMEERLDSHGSRLFTLEQLDIPQQVSIAVSEVVTDAIDWAMQVPLRNRFRDLPEADMKEILHQRMWESDSYKSHDDHMQLFEALETLMNLPPSPPPPSSTNQESPSKGSVAPSPSKTAASAEYQAWTTTDIRLRPSISLTHADLEMDEDMAPDEQAQSSDDEDIGSAHIPTVNLRQGWWKPFEKERPTGDIATFMDWFCKRRGITELKPQDLEGPAYEIIKVFHPDVIHLQYQMEEYHKLLTDSVDDPILRHNVSKPLPLGGPPGQVTIQSDFFFNKNLEYLRYGSKGRRPAPSISKMKATYYPDAGLEQMVPDQFWIEEECKYDIAAMYGISHWWFQRHRFYIDRHTSECDRSAVRTYMRILSVVRIEVFSMYGYDYMKKIVLRRVDLNEYVIAKRDFKQLVIRQCEEDFQLGIESYQTQLNLTKPQWDATGYEYKHDYTVIDSPRAAIFQDKYGVQMMMHVNEIHKFSDGTLQQIDEALDYRIKEFRINRMNPGLNTRFWTRKEMDRSKAFMFAIQRRLKTRRIFHSLESFVGGRWGFNSLVYSSRALSALRRSDLRTASTAAKPCQGDSSEFYLITGSIHTDQRGTVMTTSSANKSVFRYFFEKQKLTGPNFIDWYRQFKIVLSIEDKLNYLKQPIPPALVAPEGQQVAPEIIEFDDFVQNYNMHNLGNTINELHAMLKLHEQTLPKNNAPALHAIRAGHWKRNCPQYLSKLLKKKKLSQGASNLSIFTIELNNFLNISWIYDTCCGTHICNTTQGLRASRKLKPGALSLYVGNGQRETVKAIGVFYLCLSSGLKIILNNCHYAPSPVSCLYEDGFINRFVNNIIQVSRNNIVYFSVIPKDGIFEIDLSNSYANDSSMYAISNKRAKLDLDTALLWHCHLGHISKKCIEKLQHDGILNSTDLRAFEKYVSCMSGNMARKPYTHQVERAKNLLGLIHTDVCGPFKIMLRQGANYFVTFTDDFSRYGYVYLLKHKHEVFETFKVFQKEVENQLGKTIKLLRYDRGGEYTSQEFLDHLKHHRIIAHRTPPYTPQHNGVSERRNRTLLDMVRSMMIQTTLSKSFWDYALETAARILNMVQTKKVEKTPYEVWHGQAPKLSYLKVWGCEALVKRDTLTKPDKSTRTCHPIDRMCLYIDAEEHELRDLSEPANYKAALLDPDSDKWLNAMNVKMKFMKYNEVWDLVKLPPNDKTVGSKWLFKRKTDMDGAVHTYKARLVMKGYTQTTKIDYEETFSPVADIRAIRILIAIAAFYDYEI
nr:hypothetical protein [Tanacetum cinerariifolium]